MLDAGEGAAILTEQLRYDRYQSEVRIKSYSNRRRKPENLAMDQRRLEEMNASTPASPLREVCEDNPDITLAEAKQRRTARGA